MELEKGNNDVFLDRRAKRQQRSAAAGLGIAVRAESRAFDWMAEFVNTSLH